MARNFDNRRRAFADIVTIDAWHQDFGDNKAKADLHADVVFGTGRVGGEPDSPIRFRLSIRRAEIIVIIPETEPVAVDPSSVSRDSPNIVGRSIQTVERETHISANAAGALSLSRQGGNTKGILRAKAGNKQSRKTKLQLSSQIRLMIVTQSKTAGGDYRWIVEPQVSGVLSGRPWDALKEPRLKLLDQRKNRTKGIPPSVRVEVRCRREDLFIQDLQIKDETLWEAAKRKVGFRNKMAAAVSYIRNKLSEEGLEVSNIEDAFSEITLAAATAEPVQRP
jgi:hypothetical protein